VRVIRQRLRLGQSRFDPLEPHPGERRRNQLTDPARGGKTHTMFGPPGAHAHDERGLIFRATEAIFDEAEQLAKDKRPGLVCKVSFCELYLDQIRDLAPPAGKKQYPGPNLELAEDANGMGGGLESMCGVVWCYEPSLLLLKGNGSCPTERTPRAVREDLALPALIAVSIPVQ